MAIAQLTNKLITEPYSNRFIRYPVKLPPFVSILHPLKKHGWMLAVGLYETVSLYEPTGDFKTALNNRLRKG